MAQEAARTPAHRAAVADAVARSCGEGAPGVDRRVLLLSVLFGF